MCDTLSLFRNYERARLGYSVQLAFFVIKMLDNSARIAITEY